MQDSGMEAFHAYLPGHKDGVFLHDDLTCPFFPHWPQRIALSCISHAAQQADHGSVEILSFLIWMATLNQCEGKTSGLPISLILSLQKLGDPLLDQTHLTSYCPHPKKPKRYCRVFFTYFVVFQLQVILTEERANKRAIDFPGGLSDQCRVSQLVIPLEKIWC